MEKRKWVKVTFNVPATFNDEKKVPGSVLAKILVRIAEIGGGYSMIRGVHGGWWSEPLKKVLLDSNRLIWVIVPDSKVGAIRELVREIGTELKQEAMYFETSPVEIEFIECDND